jgi:hypothetical protein
LPDRKGVAVLSINPPHSDLRLCAEPANRQTHLSIGAWDVVVVIVPEQHADASVRARCQHANVGLAAHAVGDDLIE